MIPRIFFNIVANLFFAQAVFSQSLADSLISLIQYETADTNKVKLFLKISSALQGNDAKQSLSYAEKSLELARKLDHPVLLVRSLNATGHMYDFVDFKEKAIILHQEAITICEKNDLTKELGDTYNWLGGIYYNRAEYSKADEYW